MGNPGVQSSRGVMFGILCSISDCRVCLDPEAHAPHEKKQGTTAGNPGLLNDLVSVPYSVFYQRRP
jgi:hypothetical protein